GVGGAAAVEVVDDPVAVVVVPVAALGQVVVAGLAVVVGAVDLSVAVVVLPVGAGARAERGAGVLPAVAVAAVGGVHAVGVGAVDVVVAVVVDVVVADLGRVGGELHVELEGALVGSAHRVDGVAVEEHVVGARVEDGEIEHRVVVAGAVVVAADLLARVA